MRLPSGICKREAADPEGDLRGECTSLLIGRQLDPLERYVAAMKKITYRIRLW